MAKGMTFRNWWSVLYPATCVCCGEPADPDRLVCPACAETFLRITPPFCPFCGVSLCDCRCRKRPHAYERVVAPYYYEGRVRDAILHMKFRGREDAAIPLAAAMQQVVEAQYFDIPFDLITCVPMSRDSYARRGFNQAEALARRIHPDPVSGHPEPVFDGGLLTKKSGEQMQHFLGAEARRQNIRGALRLGNGRSVAGKTILLVDDIVTTGATAGECAGILRLHGAKAVYVATAALTRNTGPQKVHKK